MRKVGLLVLPLRNQAALEQSLKELYDPSSVSYRQYLTVEEFTAEKALKLTTAP